MSQGNQQNTQTFADPKTAFLFTLNNDMEAIYKDLTENTAKGGNKMLAFIQRLKIPDSEPFKQMKYIQDNTDMEYGINVSILDKTSNNGMSTREVWQIWRILSAYMNDTYFKDYEKGGKPQQAQPTRSL